MISRLSIYFILSLLPIFTLIGGTPEGFTSLFNGINLDGWWGAKTEDPEKWMNLPPDQFQDKFLSSKEDISKHWYVEDGVLVNDGKGLFLQLKKIMPILNYD